jgi:hypothetical protein
MKAPVTSEQQCTHPEWQSGGWIPGTREFLPDVCLSCGALRKYGNDDVEVIVTIEQEAP